MVVMVSLDWAREWVLSYFSIQLGGFFMTNKNDNRERMNKYPNTKRQDTEFNKDTDIRSNITKRDLKNKQS